ncbi:MAG: hypothetical protein QM650_01185 [Microlunatus sp.]
MREHADKEITGPADAQRTATTSHGLGTDPSVPCVQSKPAGAGLGTVHQLQGLAGNRAVTTLLQARSRTRRPGTVILQREASSVPVDPTGLAAAITVDPIARINEAEQSALTQLATTAAVHQAEVEASFRDASQQAGQSFRVFEVQSKAGEASESGQIQAASSESRSAVKQQAASARTRTHAVVGQLESETSGVAGQEAARARSAATGQQQRAVPAANGASDEEVRQGQEKIAATVQGKARTELSKAGDQAAAGIGRGQQQLSAELYGPAKSDATGKVETAATHADQAIGSGQNTAQAAVRQITGKATSESAKAKGTVTRAIASGQQQAAGDIVAWHEAGRTRISAKADEFRAEVLAGAQQFEADAQAALPDGETLDAARSEVQEGLRKGTDGMVAALADSATGLDDGLAQLAGQHTAGVSASSQQTRQHVVELGNAVRAGQQQVTSGFRATAGAAAGEATTELAAVPDRLGTQLAGPHQTGLGGIRDKADETADRASTWADEARSTGDRGSSDLDSAASSLAQEASSKQQPQVQGWFEQIVGSMRKWLKDKLGDVLGGIVSGIILAIPALLVAAALVFAGPVGWGVLAALFVVGAGMGIYSRWKEYQADHGGQGPSGWDAVGVVALGIADITGIPYIVEAAAGHRAFAPHPMSEFERWERGTEGVIFAALMFAGGAKKLFGRGHAEVPAVKAKPEVKPGSPEVKPGETPAEPGGPKATDPATVEFPPGTAYEKFQWIKQQVLAAPPGQRVQTARALLARMPAETGNAWGATEHRATNGTYWKGEKQAAIYFIDDAGNVYSGKANVDTFTYGPNGETVHPESFGAPANSGSPPPAPAPAQTPAPPPAPPSTPANPAAPPNRPGVPVPAPSQEERDPALN